MTVPMGFTAEGRDLQNAMHAAAQRLNGHFK